jgi:[ribosomal protein S18]-alanine N-acetyltransferase
LLKTQRFESLNEFHLERILEIEKASHSAPWSEMSFRAELTHPQSVFVVLIGDGNVVGYGGAWVLIDEIHITNVAVDPELRGQGLGRKIVLELLARGQEREAVCATLEVRAGNAPALGLYRSMGFVEAGLRKKYYPDNKEDAVVMWLHELP